MRTLSPADDLLHPAAEDHRWWTETYWFSFDQPGEDLSATFYPVFRPNLGVCSLGVFVWDARAHEPWRVLYGRSHWHLAMPDHAATDLRLEGLRYEALEPLQRYRVSYSDPDRIDVDLEFSGLRDPYVAFLERGSGHFDQAMRVVGSVTTNDRRIEIDTVGMRDRTWSVRPEDKRGPAGGYSYGHASADDQFLVVTRLEGNDGTTRGGLFNGYLVRDGELAPVVESGRRVVARRRGYPVEIELEATDALGRRLELRGQTRNRFANQATPSQFAWMSMTEWHDASGRTVVGQDQESRNPSLLGPALDRLDTLR